MAEDQGVNGDRWNEQAGKLLQRLGWSKVADSNIDIPGTDGLIHGIDALYKYDDNLRRCQQGLFIEAKRYLTTSFHPGKLQDWVDTLNKKITELRRSESFNLTYPEMSTTVPQNGVLFLWFHDIDNFEKFRSGYQSALRNIKVPRGRKSIINRLFIFSNDDLLRLASVASAVIEGNSRNNGGDRHRFRFFYPSSMGEGVLSYQADVMTLEYMVSKFVIVKSIEFVNGTSQDTFLVFYFGNLSMLGFECLKKALLRLNVPPDRNSVLHIYHYQRSDNFRKIAPDVEKLFQDAGATGVKLHSMDILHNLPGWMMQE